MARGQWVNVCAIIVDRHTLWFEAGEPCCLGVFAGERGREHREGRAQGNVADLDLLGDDEESGERLGK